MEYQTTEPFSGNPEKAMELAQAVLIQHNFRLETKSAHTLQASGPGMNSTRQNPLVGVSELEITIAETQIALQAELGGVTRIRNFMFLMPLGLGAGLGVCFLFLFGLTFSLEVGLGTCLMSLLPVAPWPFLAPFIANRLKKRTTQALDNLLHNMSMQS